MATSSIFTKIKIDDSKKAKAFINALDASSKESTAQQSVSTISTTTDKESIYKLMVKKSK